MKKAVSILICMALTSAALGAGYTKPPLGARLNYGSWAARDLVGAWTFNSGAGIPQEYTGYVRPYSTTGTPVWLGGLQGPAVYYNGSSLHRYTDLPSSFFGTSAKTIIVRVKFNSFDTALNDPFLEPCPGDGSAGSFLGMFAEDNGISCGFQGHRLIWGKSSLSTDVWYTFAITIPANATSDQAKGYLNGNYLAATLEAGAPVSVDLATFGTFTIGGNYSASALAQCSISYVYCYNRELSADEIKTLYQEPFQMFSETQSVPQLYRAITLGGGQVILIGY